MEQDAWVIVLRRPVKREGSVQYMILVVVSFAMSVSLTRLYLSLANYPQIGSGELHIAHVLWGGLLLFIAALLLLLISSRSITRAAAILAGAGIGLFIDEVGKFITQKNDYFYPAAAAIIYIFFMLTLVLLVYLRRKEKATDRAELSRSLEMLQDWIYYPLSQNDRQLLLERLNNICEGCSSEMIASLARGILSVVQQDPRPAPVKRSPLWAPVTNRLGGWISERALRSSLAIGFLVMALVAFKNPFEALVVPHLPPYFDPIHWGRYLVIESAASQLRVGLEIVLGCLLLAVSGLLFTRRIRIAVPLGFGALLVYMGTINIFLFYFEQFSTILLLIYQFILFLGLLWYRTRFQPGGQAIRAIAPVAG